MSNIQTALSNLENIFQVTEDFLNDWTGEGNLQFPVLMGMLAIKMNWDPKEVRETDPIIRYYVRKHPDWYVTRGARGGIMRASDKVKKNADKKAREDAKAKMKAAIEAKAFAEDQ